LLFDDMDRARAVLPAIGVGVFKPVDLFGT
jgi:hypothetical protein